jgi:hypothetical protein
MDKMVWGVHMRKLPAQVTVQKMPGLPTHLTELDASPTNGNMRLMDRPPTGETEVHSRQLQANSLLRSQPIADRTNPHISQDSTSFLVMAVQWHAAKSISDTESHTLLHALKRLFSVPVGTNVLPLINRDDVLLLIPLLWPEPSEIQRSTAMDLLSVLRPPGLPVVGLARAETETRLPAAADEARMILTIARITGRKPGIYSFHDMPLEALLSRSPDLAARLAGIIHPLKGGSDYLLNTLVTYLHLGRRRSETAHQLRIHPNTLDYRLRKIHQLTGLSTTDTYGLQKLAMAIAAWDLLDRSPGRFYPRTSGSEPPT